MRLLSFFTNLLHFLPPEASHNVALLSLKFIHRIGILRFLTAKIDKQQNSATSRKELQHIFPARTKNKLGIAAGLDKNGDFIDSLASLGIGFLELGTVTPRPQSGNDKPRLFRDKKNAALLNRMGFNNKGVDYLVKKVKKRKTSIPLGISIGKNFDTPLEEAYKDYLLCLDKVYEYADYVAVNISSPNTANLRELSSREYFDDLSGRLKELQIKKSHEYKYVPLYIKISPDENNDGILDICNSIRENKIDGIICTNTSTNHRNSYGGGGMSGSPLMPSSTRVQKRVRSLLGSDFLIIASGGVMNVSDYIDKIQAGADLVQIYTGFIYKGPKLITDILNFKEFRA